MNLSYFCWMKKLFTTFVLSIYSVIALSQSLTFKKILYVAQNGGADTYLKEQGFTKGKDFHGFNVYIINAGTMNEEQFSYDPRGSSYQTNNVEFMKSLEQQVKKEYNLILRDDDSKYETYCEYGTPDWRIIFSFSKKPGRLSKIDIIKH